MSSKKRERLMTQDAKVGSPPSLPDSIKREKSPSPEREEEKKKKQKKGKKEKKEEKKEKKKRTEVKKVRKRVRRAVVIKREKSPSPEREEEKKKKKKKEKKKRKMTPSPTACQKERRAAAATVETTGPKRRRPKRQNKSSSVEEATSLPQTAASCPLCGGPAGHKGHYTYKDKHFCETAAAGRMSLREWMKTCFPKTTIWRLEKKWKAMQEGPLPPRKQRTCHLCGQHMVKATGHSIYRTTKETFCATSDPERRTVEQWLTEKRGGVSSETFYKTSWARRCARQTNKSHSA